MKIDPDEQMLGVTPVSNALATIIVVPSASASVSRGGQPGVAAQRPEASIQQLAQASGASGCRDGCEDATASIVEQCSTIELISGNGPVSRPKRLAL